MTTSLDTIRYHSGIAGEEVADMVDSLEQEVSTLREQVEKLTAALKLAREALKFDGYPCGTGCKCIACESLAAIDALGE